MTVGILGLGLIGGSMASAYAKAGHTVLAAEKDSDIFSFATLSGAVHGILDETTIGSCELILLAIYPGGSVAWLEQNAPLVDRNALVMDCCGIKREVCSRCFPLAEKYGFTFIGGHPMAGSEKTGVQNSKRILLENAYYILTPTRQVAPELLEKYRTLVTSLKALPLILTCEEHDFATGAISHLPHIIASSLVNLIKDSDTEKHTMKTIAAGGFKDITRIASSSPEMWEQICATNKDNILTILSRYIDSLESIRSSLKNQEKDAIHHLFADSREYRNSISDTSQGPLPKSHSLYCDMVDEAGGIAALATILATNGISIKNIGIVHNREFEEAVLHVEFYEESALKNAVELLRKYRYVIYERS